MNEENNKDYDLIISNLTKRIYHLEQEVVKLGGQPYLNAKVTDTGVSNNVQAQKIENIPKSEIVYRETDAQPKAGMEDIVPIKTEAEQIPELEPQTAGSYMDNKHIAPNNAVKNKKNIESRIGKNFMAVVASVLIFFSLILFGGIAFKYLSDGAKAVIMYAISISMTVFGIIKIPSRSNGDNDKYKFKTFYTSLAACGIGITYISGLISYFTFQLFSLWVFAFILIIWLLATMFLAYRYSDIFVYICNVGLVISTVLVTFQFENCLLGFVIYSLCLAGLYIINHSDNFNRDCFYFIQYPIIFILLSVVHDTASFGYIVTGIFLLVVFMLANILYRIESKHIASNIITLLLNIVAIIYIAATNFDNSSFIYIAICMLLAISVMYWIRYHDQTVALFYVSYSITLIVSVCMFIFTTGFALVGWLPYAMLIFVGFLCKDKYIRLGGYITLMLSLLKDISVMSPWVILGIYMIIVIASVVLMIVKEYSMLDKYCITAAAFVVIYFLADIQDISRLICYVLTSAIVVFMNTGLYHMDYRTHESEYSSKIIGYVANGITMIIGLYVIKSTEVTPETYQLIIGILVTLVLYSLNVKRLFRLKLPEMVVGIYICLKFTIFIYTIMNRLEAVSFVISIVGIVIAITCIVTGFATRHKSFRLYGLVVSLISVAKLILFDIQYDSDILRPIGFFVAGILCFAISFIYSRLEKREDASQD